MPPHVTGPAPNSNRRSFNRTMRVSKVLLGGLAVASIVVSVYLAESYPKRKIPVLNRIYQSELPYGLYALEPYISSETMDFHYNMHDYGYEKKLLGLVNNTEMSGMSLMQILELNATSDIPIGVANNAGQLMNHNIFWVSMTPNKTAHYPAGVSGPLQEQIIKDFGSLDSFLKEFVSKGVGLFGSGWVWVAYNHEQGKIELFTSANGNYPSPPSNYVVLFNCDVWEHAYYIDYRNRREDYLKNFLRVLDWAHASTVFEKI